MKVLFVLPVKGGGGGAHSVAQEVGALNQMGVSAKIAVNSGNYPSFITCYADMPDVCRNVVVFDRDTSLAQHLEWADLAICTLFTSVDLVRRALEHTAAKPKVGYYAQDYEPLFLPPQDPLWQQAFDSYTLIPEMMVFAKTNWIREVIQANHGIHVKKVAASLDHDVYVPMLKKNTQQIWVSAMVRPATPRRAPQRTMRVLKNLKTKLDARVNINIFGCTDADIYHGSLPADFEFFNHGVLTRRQVAALLGKSHLFLDLSDYQAFGRTGLEAMACGCVPLVPSLGGTDEYIRDQVNGYAIDPRNEELVLDTIIRFCSLDSQVRNSMAIAACDTAQNFSVRKAAFSELKIFSEMLPF